MDSRQESLQLWVEQHLGLPAGEGQLVPASDDASFRRYFRLAKGTGPYVFVDAPPDLEDSRPFVAVSGALVAAGLNAPVVAQFDEQAGFMMVSDLGNDLYLPALQSTNRMPLYRLAVDALVDLQAVPMNVAAYDAELLQTEMNLFPDWLLTQQLNLALSATERQLLADVFATLIVNAGQQPQVFVHRDYHSRNLMICGDRTPGILDFQDAVRGPLTYDLVSLLRDCYYRLEVDELSELVAYARGRLAGDVDQNTFRRWFDLMGLQRHLKCAGIFCRLNLRDGKDRYLRDIPLVVDYIREVAGAYPEFSAFSGWLEERLVPLLPTLKGDS